MAAQGSGSGIHAPEGWYPNPSGVGQRFWTGTNWSAHVRELMPAEQRRRILAAELAHRVRKNCRVQSRSEFEAVLAYGHRPNHRLHLILTIVTLGLWLIPWIILSIMGREKRKVLTVDAFGHLHSAR